MVEQPHCQSTQKCGNGNIVLLLDPLPKGYTQKKDKQKKPHYAKLNGNLQKDVVRVHHGFGSANGKVRIDGAPCPLPHANANGMRPKHAQRADPCLQAVTDGALAKVSNAEKPSPKALGQKRKR